MSRFLKLFLVVSVILSVGVSFAWLRNQHGNPVPILRDSPGKVAQLEAELKAIKEASSKKEEADERLGQYVINMMYKSPETVQKLSPGLMNVLARNIVRDTNDVMGDDATLKQFFIGAVQFESKFLKFAQSPTGPKGLSQTTKATFHEALKYCGVSNVHDDDVWDSDMSIYAGACYFKWLYVSYYNNSKQCPDDPKEPWKRKVCAGQMASVAYNQGPESRAAKSFAKSGILDELEPAIYNGKVISNLTRTPDTKLPGVPSISDLPKPSSKEAISNIKPSKTARK